MDPRVEKLRRRGIDPQVAEDLVKAGIDSPRKIKAAKIADLRKAKADKAKPVVRWRSKK